MLNPRIEFKIETNINMKIQPSWSNQLLPFTKLMEKLPRKFYLLHKWFLLISHSSYYTRRKFRPIYAKVMNSYVNTHRKSSTFQRHPGANSMSLVTGLLPFTSEMALFEFPFNELLVSKQTKTFHYVRIVNFTGRWTEPFLKNILKSHGLFHSFSVSYKHINTCECSE